MKDLKHKKALLAPEDGESAAPSSPCSSVSQKTKSRSTVRAVQILLVLAALQYPIIGYCDSGSGWLKNLFGSTGKNMKNVAIKVTELPEKYNINVQGLDFSPNGKFLAVRSADEFINIWDWQAGRIARTVEKAQGAEDGLTTEPMRYSPDGRLFAACHERAVNNILARIWNTDTWQVAHDIVDALPGGCRAIGFTPDGKSLLRISHRNHNFPADDFIVYDVDTWRPQWGLRTWPFYPNALAISPDGKFAALGGEVIVPGPIPDKQQIVIVDLAKHAIVNTIPDTVSFSFGRLAWSPDGAYLAAIGHRAWDGAANHGQGAYVGGPDTFMVFDAHSGKQVTAGQWGELGQLSLRYTPDGKYLIEGDVNDKGTGLGARIWDSQHRELLQTIPGNVGSLAVSKDGRFLAIGSDKKTTIWQLK